MEWILVLIYLLGMFIGSIVVRHRAGVGQSRIKILGSTGFGFIWFWRMTFAVAFWPITLVVWLARGRPEPHIVFNERAAERRRLMKERGEAIS
ncbi:hypothetical protein [Actinoplanes sp. DH11]|uniref:hypothetical protein n=1 Tax=Actinoplanes sp. DH11 TaxID=2857011 RepID=UPI001E54327D|nr:hypothetical protein [Actinoplanes sp. DH11]